MNDPDPLTNAKHALQTGDYSTAATLCQKFLEHNFMHIDALNILGVAQYQSRAFDAAISTFEKIISLNPAYQAAYFNLGTVFKALQQLSAARTAYQSALELMPTQISILEELADICTKQQDYEAAITYLHQIIALEPGLVYPHEKCAAILTTLGQTKNADEENFYAQIKSLPDNSSDSRIQLCNEFLSKYPDHVYAHIYKGVAQEALNNSRDAITCYQQALATDPKNYLALVNKGNSEQTLARYKEASASYDAAFAINPDYVPVRLNRAFCNLLLGNFSSGWETYESRLVSPQLLNRTDIMADYQQFKAVQWQGEPHTNDYLFIWNEQGIGDEILFSSMYNDVNSFFEKVIIETDERLVDLFTRSFPNAHVIARKLVRDYSPPDNKKIWYLPCGGLGQFLRKSPLDFPDTRRFLIADTQKTDEIRQQLKKDSSPLIGLSWKSFARAGKYKSLPFADLVGVLAQSPAASYVSLQYQPDDVEYQLFEDLMHQPLLRPDFDVLGNIDELAALTNACDYIITGSNVTAHLAGALGKPTFLLVPTGTGLIWYWGAYQSTTPWYPSIHIVRQSEPGNWHSVFEQLTRLLQEISPPS